MLAFIACCKKSEKRKLQAMRCPWNRSQGCAGMWWKKEPKATAWRTDSNGRLRNSTSSASQLFQFLQFPSHSLDCRAVWHQREWAGWRADAEVVWSQCDSCQVWATGAVEANALLRFNWQYGMQPVKLPNNRPSNQQSSWPTFRERVLVERSVRVQYSMPAILR